MPDMYFFFNILSSHLPCTSLTRKLLYGGTVYS